jgi:hypothetical protein
MRLQKVPQNQQSIANLSNDRSAPRLDASVRRICSKFSKHVPMVPFNLSVAASASITGTSKERSAPLDPRQFSIRRCSGTELGFMVKEKISRTSLGSPANSIEKFRDSIERTIRISRMASDLPGQTRGPPPNRVKACRKKVPSARRDHRPGSNAWALVKYFSSIIAGRAQRNTCVPAGNKMPSRTKSRFVSRPSGGVTGLKRIALKATPSKPSRSFDRK